MAYGLPDLAALFRQESATLASSNISDHMARNFLSPIRLGFLPSSSLSQSEDGELITRVDQETARPGAENAQDKLTHAPIFLLPQFRARSGLPGVTKLGCGENHESHRIA
jgi:hypothetical protein